MAKTDYYVIVYRILAYLYACLTQNKDVDLAYLGIDSPIFIGVEHNYYCYIFEHMQKDELIEGVIVAKLFGGKDAKITKYVTISPKGIAYLSENSMMAKARDFLKTLKEIIPGL